MVDIKNDFHYDEVAKAIRKNWWKLTQKRKEIMFIWFLHIAGSRVT